MKLSPLRVLPLLLVIGGNSVLEMWHAVAILSSAPGTCWAAPSPLTPAALHLGLLRDSPLCHNGTFLLGDLAVWLIGAVLALSASTLIAGFSLLLVALGGLAAARRALAATADWLRRRLVLLPHRRPRFSPVLPWPSHVLCVVASGLATVVRRRGPPRLLLAGP